MCHLDRWDAVRSLVDGQHIEIRPSGLVRMVSVANGRVNHRPEILVVNPAELDGSVKRIQAAELVRSDTANQWRAVAHTVRVDDANICIDSPSGGCNDELSGR